MCCKILSKKVIFRLLILMLSAKLIIFTCYASCDVHIKGVDYYYGTNDLYQINLKIDDICSKGYAFKRELSKIRLDLYRKNVKVFSKVFDRGLWMPSSSKFFLESNKVFTKGCLKGTKSITIDLTNKYLNSIVGLYLNFKTGETLNLKCDDINGIEKNTSG
jgi:hypothetical protein